MSMTDVRNWKLQQCNDVEAMLLILSKVYKHSRNDKPSADAKRVKVLRTDEDEKTKPIDVMKCLLPEIEKCAEEFSKLEEIVNLLYEKDLYACLKAVQKLKRSI
nr:hypothetical protein [uncultured Faecalimonas sp.]